MNKLLRLCILALAALLALPAHAVQRTFVASFGLDTNPCSVTSPCRSFTTALTATSPGGEIIVLDSAGYGAVTITQSVSIIAPDGVYAGISVLTGDGVTVNAGPSDKVVLRGLTINGQGGNRGIVVQAGQAIHIERCVVSNMALDGIEIAGGTAVHVSDSVLRLNAVHGIDIIGGTAEIHVTDTRLAQNGNHGVLAVAGEALVLDRVRVENNGFNGVQVLPGAGVAIRVSVRDTKIVGNPNVGLVLDSRQTGSVVHGFVERTSVVRNGFGFLLQTGTLGTGSLAIDSSVASDNLTTGVGAFGTGKTLYLRNSTVMRNDTGLAQGTNAVFNTCGNNLLALNTTATVGTITAAPADCTH